mmetsp:Transcript_14895/g.34683  ORF Transcript_14895/g.34683 Transcript_14895/m.34683 type:complete len:931 (+) Transcript_14895:109-2901(+)
MASSEAEALSRRLEAAYARLAAQRPALASVVEVLYEFATALDATRALTARHGRQHGGGPLTYANALRALVALGAAPREPAPSLQQLPPFPVGGYDAAFSASSPQPAAAVPPVMPAADAPGGGISAAATGPEMLRIEGATRMGEVLVARLSGGSLKGRVLQWFVRPSHNSTGRWSPIIGANKAALALTAEELDMTIRLELFAPGAQTTSSDCVAECELQTPVGMHKDVYDDVQFQFKKGAGLRSSYATFEVAANNLSERVIQLNKRQLKVRDHMRWGGKSLYKVPFDKLAPTAVKLDRIDPLRFSVQIAAGEVVHFIVLHTAMRDVLLLTLRALHGQVQPLLSGDGAFTPARAERPAPPLRTTQPPPPPQIVSTVGVDRAGDDEGCIDDSKEIEDAWPSGGNVKTGEAAGSGGADDPRGDGGGDNGGGGGRESDGEEGADIRPKIKVVIRDAPLPPVDEAALRKAAAGFSAPPPAARGGAGRSRRSIGPDNATNTSIAVTGFDNLSNFENGNIGNSNGGNNDNDGGGSGFANSGDSTAGAASASASASTSVTSTPPRQPPPTVSAASMSAGRGVGTSSLANAFVRARLGGASLGGGLVAGGLSGGIGGSVALGAIMRLNAGPAAPFNLMLVESVHATFKGAALVSYSIQGEIRLLPLGPSTPAVDFAFRFDMAKAGLIRSAIANAKFCAADTNAADTGIPTSLSTNYLQMEPASPGDGGKSLARTGAAARYRVRVPVMEHTAGEGGRSPLPLLRYTVSTSCRPIPLRLLPAWSRTHAPSTDGTDKGGPAVAKLDLRFAASPALIDGISHVQLFITPPEGLTELSGPVRPSENAVWSNKILEVTRSPLQPASEPLRLVAHFTAPVGDNLRVSSKPQPAAPLVVKFAAAGSTASGVDVLVESSEEGGAPPSQSVSRVLRRFLSGAYEVHPNFV